MFLSFLFFGFFLRLVVVCGCSSGLVLLPIACILYIIPYGQYDVVYMFSICVVHRVVLFVCGCPLWFFL